MKTKITSVVSTAVLLSATLFSIASAQSLGLNVSANVEVETRGNSTSTAAKAAVHGNATNTMRYGYATSTDDNGRITSAEHRSTVATFVQSLLNVANREGGIGLQVREIAKAQNDSSATTTSAMTKVEGRGSVRTFFFGSDYRNLGVIRSELATTSKNIARLKALLSSTTNASDRAELSAQIQVLEAEQVKVDAYVKAHESTFSLFGWFTRLFVK